MLNRGPVRVVGVASPGMAWCVVVARGVGGYVVGNSRWVVSVRPVGDSGVVVDEESVVEEDELVVVVTGRVAAGSMNSVVDKTLVANGVEVVEGVITNGS
jgi:hypothetical protein